MYIYIVLEGEEIHSAYDEETFQKIYKDFIDKTRPGNNWYRQNDILKVNLNKDSKNIVYVFPQMFMMNPWQNKDNVLYLNNQKKLK